MKSLILLCLVGFVGCATIPSAAKKVFLASTVSDAVHFRTSEADVAMNFSEVEKALGASTFAPDTRERLVRLLRDQKGRKYFTEAWPQDEVGSAIAETVLPALLEHGDALVTDLKSKRTVEFIYVSWVSRGEIGPSFLLPDGREFFRHAILVE